MCIRDRDKNVRETLKPLVRVEIAPGRFVKCHAGDEEKVKEHFASLQQRGRGAEEQASRKRRRPAKDKMRRGPEDKAKKKEKEKAGG